MTWSAPTHRHAAAERRTDVLHVGNLHYASEKDVVERALGRRVEEALPHVLVDQGKGHPVKGRLSGADLLQHVDAVAVFLDHPRDAADLPLRAAQALEGGVSLAWGLHLSRRLHTPRLTYRGGVCKRAASRYSPLVCERRR